MSIIDRAKAELDAIMNEGGALKASMDELSEWDSVAEVVMNAGKIKTFIAHVALSVEKISVAFRENCEELKSEEKLRVAAEWVDSKILLPWYLEAFDGPAIRLILKYVVAEINEKVGHDWAAAGFAPESVGARSPMIEVNKEASSGDAPPFAPSAPNIGQESQKVGAAATTTNSLGRFVESLSMVFASEGGFSNNKNDAGGRTNLGITESVLQSAFKSGIIPHDDITKVTKAQAETIYFERYWKAVRADMLPAPVDYLVFDAAVNCGPGTAVRFLQNAVGFVTGASIQVDGVFGPATMKAVRDACATSVGVKAMGCAFLLGQMGYYLSISDGVADTAARRAQEVKNREFLRGWMNRLEKKSSVLGV